ncbi:hypothetical protein MTR67_023337 [Solanum verrucosum]|uniref:Malic enzyme NAD-binding domain-containing protein n=1 Tax=Solanum verrucosum TaxID=315347 RepID=A0AAF0QTB6_SOLVR|nr:hypothetical protein MTR67_023337 [Solanum verrucosum]
MSVCFCFLYEYYDFLDEFMKVVKQNYGEKVLVQGTTVVVLAGLVASLKLLGVSLADHTFLFFGAGEAGTGIAELIALVISKKGLIVNARNESLQAHKKPWAHEHEPVNNLLDTVKAIKPAAIIGTSGVGRTFTEEVIEAMSSINKRPLIMAFSNPTAQSECTTEEAYTWSERVESSSQVEVHSILARAEVLAMQIAAKAYELGVATRLPQPVDLVKYAESCMYNPNYHSYC